MTKKKRKKSTSKGLKIRKAKVKEEKERTKAVIKTKGEFKEKIEDSSNGSLYDNPGIA